MSEKIRHERRVDQIGFAAVNHYLTLDHDLSDGAYRVYALLLKYARQQPDAFPGVPALAADLGKGERTISRLLVELETRGLVSRQRRWKRSSVTWLADLERVYGQPEHLCESAKNGRNTNLPKMAGHEPAKNGRTEEEKKEKEKNIPEPEPTPAALLWSEVLQDTRAQMTAGTWSDWLEPTRAVQLDNGTLTVDAGSELRQDWLDNRLRATVERSVAAMHGGPLAVKFSVGGAENGNVNRGAE